MKKHISISVVLLLVTLGWSTPAFTEQPPEPRGEVRIVDLRRSSRKSIVNARYDRLVGVDRDGQLVPQLATSWRWLDDRTFEMSLRRGVTSNSG